MLSILQDTNALLQQRLEHTDTDLNQRLQQTQEVSYMNIFFAKADRGSNIQI